MSHAEAAPIVLTGATGFIGRELVRRLVAADAPGASRPVTLLLRHPESTFPEFKLPPTWRVLACDFSDPAVLIPPDALPPGCIVIHLAAATGRAPAPVMRQVNVAGTRAIATAAQRAGAAHFILVSSIAAGYERQRWYPYAASKLEAEAAAIAAGVPTTIVRPTVVFGPGSRVQEGLEQLAMGRWPVVLGSGDVLVQPVDVRDLAGFLLALAASEPAGMVPLEVGGAEQYSMRSLLGAIRSRHGLLARSLWSVPLGLPRLGLAMAEKVLGPRLPVTAGQLSAFLNDSVAAPHPVVTALLPSGDPLRALPSALGPGAGTGTMSAAGAGAILEEEFRVFAAHLGTPEPSPGAVEAYCGGNPRAVAVTADALDERLVRLARRSPAWCALADCYARVTRPHGLLRRKLVLALAVLESVPATHAHYDQARTAPAPAAWATVVLLGVRWLVTLPVAVLMLGPGHLLGRRTAAREPGQNG